MFIVPVLLSHETEQSQESSGGPMGFLSFFQNKTDRFYFYDLIFCSSFQKSDVVPSEPFEPSEEPLLNPASALLLTIKNSKKLSTVHHRL